MTFKSRQAVGAGEVASLDGASIASFYASLVGITGRGGEPKGGVADLEVVSQKSDCLAGVSNRAVGEQAGKTGKKKSEKRENLNSSPGDLLGRAESHRGAGISGADDPLDSQSVRAGLGSAKGGVGSTQGMTQGVQVETLNVAEFIGGRQNVQLESAAGRSGGHGLERAEGVGLTKKLSPLDKQSSSYRGKIPEGNIGYKMLKKAGWNEKTGLGASEQGPLEPVKAQIKGDKRGIGAEKQAKQALGVSSGTKRKDAPAPGAGNERGKRQLTRAEMKQSIEREKQKEEVIAKYIYRAFAPDNV